MEQNSSTKRTRVISLHDEWCGHARCPHRSTCYHVNKKQESDLSFGFGLEDRITLLKYDNVVMHESVCNKLKPFHWHLLKFYKNYNITLPASHYKPYLDRVKDQVQLTVYNEHQIEIYREYQKLFLIKDNRTWQFYLDHIHAQNKLCSKVHYIFDQAYMTKDKFRQVVSINNLATDPTATIDTCFRSFVLNGRCPNSYFNYMDITFDGTVRLCPYAKEGLKVPEEELSRLIREDIGGFFKLKPPCVRCKYMDLFEGELDV